MSECHLAVMYSALLGALLGTIISCTIIGVSDWRRDKRNEREDLEREERLAKIRKSYGLD